jgi:CubicO group peptidase (beta-lactamase class C family)
MRTLLGRVSLVSTLALVACGGAEPAPPTTPATAPPASASAPTPPTPPVSPAAPVPEKIGADTPRAMAGGTTFTAPGGFTLTNDGGRVVLCGPEEDLKLALVETTAKTADEAVAQAWPALHPDFKRPLKITQPRPGRHGWDEERVYVYETSPNEKSVVVARAVRHGEAWFVLLLDAGEGSLEKRSAAISLLVESTRPAGYTRESFAGKTPHAIDAERLKQITDFVEQGRDALNLPGVAISLVQDGKVVFEGGFGVREMGKPAKVDAETLFNVASNTKAMATLLLAEEVDEKKFTWDTPVTQVYPSFRLGDADTTSKVLMRHLVCACTGMPRQDMEWLFEYAHSTPDTAIKLLGTMQPTTKFGETFQYSNLMAAAAGFIGGQVAYPKKELGAAFDEAMQTKVFAPLGMASTTLDFAKALRGNHASPHGLDVDGKMTIASMDINRSVIPARPAGGAWSSVKDMTRYVQMELANGKLPSGKALLSADALLARRAPNVASGEDETYGMGLEVN